jgi:hypothetical protein
MYYEYKYHHDASFKDKSGSYINIEDNIEVLLEYVQYFSLKTLRIDHRVATFTSLDVKDFFHQILVIRNDGRRNIESNHRRTVNAFCKSVLPTELMLVVYSFLRQYPDTLERRVESVYRWYTYIMIDLTGNYPNTEAYVDKQLLNV